MRFLPIAVLASFAVCAAHADTKFTAYMVTKDQPLFIVEADGAASVWLPLGGEFHGRRLSAFDPKTETLTVDNSGVKESLPLKASKVSAAQVDPNETLRTLKGMALAYEVARWGDENMRLLLIRYQQVLAAVANGAKGQQDVLGFLRMNVDRLAADGAQKILGQQPNKATDRTAPSVTPPAAQEPRH